MKVSVAVPPVLTAKLLALVPVPAEFETLTGPVVAPVGTLARNCVSESNEKLAAGVPLNETPVMPVKLLPLMVTDVPTVPLVGVNDVMLGGRITVKFVALVPVPLELVTLMGPLVAATGTVARICVLESMSKVAAAPLKSTATALANSAPVIVTSVPV